MITVKDTPVRLSLGSVNPGENQLGISATIVASIGTTSLNLHPGNLIALTL